MNKKEITAEEFDKIFDDGEEDVLQYADLSTITKRVNVDFPVWAIKKLDWEAKRVGSSRQSLIRNLVINFLDERARFEIERVKVLSLKHSA
jgi:hypothetical protein